jgi:glycerophosphoryl diester phosphodiesterase
VSRPLVIAHRGASGYELENSLAAFRAAARLGADAVELDIHETADGAFVVHHGNMVAGRHVSQCALAELRGRALPNGEPIPTLAEALEVILPHLMAYVEAKKVSPENDARLGDVIDGSPAPARVALHAFDHRIIQRFAARRPRTRRGIISASYPVDPVRCVADAGAQTLWEEWPLIDEALVQALHGAGMTVYAWTVNDREQMDRLLRLGVDGLATDLPDVARQALDAHPW